MSKNRSTIIITGASRGLGAAVARAAAAAGANVTLNARSVDDLERVAAEIRQEAKGRLEIGELVLSLSKDWGSRDSAIPNPQLIRCSS